MDEKQLIKMAIEAREKAYVPYSHFSVGAALLTRSGKVYTGCNIENISFGATNCAERTAIFKAVSEGEMKFDKIAVSGGSQNSEPDTFCYPCAICLQVMSEFCEPEFEILVVKSETEVKHCTLKELLPIAFDSLTASS